MNGAKRADGRGSTEALVEAINRLAAVARQTPEPVSSVELTVSAKGVVQPTVKIYAADPHQAAEAAKDIYDRLADHYARKANADQDQAAGGQS